MAKWYAAHNTTPADPESVQEVPNPGAYTDLVTGDYCFLEKGDMLHLYKYLSTSAETEKLDTVITPTGNAGNGRWIQKQAYKTGENGFFVKQGPPTDSTISFTDGTLTFSIQPTATSFEWFINGVHHTSTGDTVVITDVEGLHWIYYDTDGVLKVQAPGGSTDDLILEKCLVANVYWDATNNEGIIVGEERHGNSMSPATHYHFHEAIGALYESGLGLANFDIDGSGADATAAQFDVTDGEFHDEDIEITVVDGSPQQLVNATIPTFYRLGAGGAWRKLDATANFPVADGTIDLRLDWNDYNGGTWQLQEVANLQFVLTHYFATNDIATPIIGIMGQATYATANAARAGAETELASVILAGLPSAEFLAIATTIWQTADSYGNQVAARLRSTDTGDDYIDWRQTTITGAGGTTSDHESLAGLLGGGVGDHYHLTSVQETDLTDGGDTTLHDHDGIAENTAARHTQGTDVALGVMTQDINMNALYQIVGLQAPAALAETIRQTATITEVNLNQLTAAGQTDLHYHDQLKDGGVLGVQVVAAGATELYHVGVKVVATQSTGGLTVYNAATVAKKASLYVSSSFTYLQCEYPSMVFQLLARNTADTLNNQILVGDPDGATSLYYIGVKALETGAGGVTYFYDATAANYGYIQHDATNFIMYNNKLAGAVSLYANRTGEGAVPVLIGEPDDDTRIYYHGIKCFATNGSGISIFDSSGNDPACTFHGADFAVNGNIQFLDDGSVTMLNSVNTHNLFRAMGNGATSLYYAGNVKLATIAAGFSSLGVTYTINSNRLFIDNLNTSGEITLRGWNSADVLKNMVYCDPDAEVQLLHTGTLAVYTTSSPGIYVIGTCSALVFTDRTPSYEGTNAVSDLNKITSKAGKIDHSTLPVFAQKKVTRKDGTKEDGRDLGAMISILVKAVQELSAEIDELKAVKK